MELQLHHAVLTETVQKRQAELGDTRGLLADVQVHRSALAESVQNLNETVQGLLAACRSLS